MLEMGVILTAQQESAITHVLKGRDVVAKMPTGTGKSLIFQALIYSHCKRKGQNVTIIITPLKSISYTHIKSFEKVFISSMYVQ